jgi:hypothetical protein
VGEAGIFFNGVYEFEFANYIFIYLFIYFKAAKVASGLDHFCHQKEKMETPLQPLPQLLIIPS